VLQILDSGMKARILNVVKKVKSRVQCTYDYLHNSVEPGKLTFFLASFVTPAAKNIPPFSVVLRNFQTTTRSVE